MDEKALQAKLLLTQGLKNEFQQIIKYRPKQYPKLIDSIKTKFPQDAIIFGKPNILINQKQSNEFGFIINKLLDKFPLDHLIDLAEQFSQSASAQNQIMTKIFD